MAKKKVIKKATLKEKIANKAKVVWSAVQRTFTKE